MQYSEFSLQSELVIRLGAIKHLRHQSSETLFGTNAPRKKKQTQKNNNNKNGKNEASPKQQLLIPLSSIAAICALPNMIKRSSSCSIGGEDCDSPMSFRRNNHGSNHSLHSVGTSSMNGNNSSHHSPIPRVSQHSPKSTRRGGRRLSTNTNSKTSGSKKITPKLVLFLIGAIQAAFMFQIWFHSTMIPKHSGNDKDENQNNNAPSASSLRIPIEDALSRSLSSVRRRKGEEKQDKASTSLLRNEQRQNIKSKQPLQEEESKLHFPKEGSNHKKGDVDNNNNGDLVLGDDIFNTKQHLDIIVTSQKAWWEGHDEKLATIWQPKQSHEEYCLEEWIPNGILTQEQYLSASVPGVGQSSRGLIYIKTGETFESTIEGVTFNIAHQLGQRVHNNKWKKCVTHTMFEYAWGNCHVDMIQDQSLLFSFLRHPQSRDISQTFKDNNWKELPSSSSSSNSNNNIDTTITDYIENNHKGFQTRALVPERGGWQRHEWNGKREGPLEKWPRKSLRRGVKEGLLDYLSSKIFNNYNFLGIVERMEESLAVMVLLWGLNPSDVIVLSKEKQCGEVSRISPAFEMSGIEHYFQKQHSIENVDYLVYHAANHSLTKTIESLGKENVDSMIEEIRALQQLAESSCSQKTNFGCSNFADGLGQGMESGCYYTNAGCAHRCVSESLIDPTIESVLTQHNSTTTTSVVANLKYNTTTKFFIYDDDIIYQKFLMRKLRKFHKASLVDPFEDLKAAIEAENNVWHALWNHPLRTSNPKEAELFMIPTPITELIAHGCTEFDCIWFDEAFGALSRHPVFRTQTDGGNNHVLVSFHWSTFNPRHASLIPALARSYSLLENVTVASHYDPFGCAELSKTTNMNSDFGKLFSQELPVTKAFSIGLYGPEVAMNDPSFIRFTNSKNFLFYRTRHEKSQHDSASYRRVALKPAVIQSLPKSNMEYYESNIPSSVASAWANAPQSKFCLLVRGETPRSDSLLLAVRSGCIPVIVSNFYQQYAGPFKTSLEMKDFTISIDESKFLVDPASQLLSLQNLEDDFVKEKLKNLTIAQALLFPDHPESLFVEAFLNEAKSAKARSIFPEAKALKDKLVVARRISIPLNNNDSDDIAKKEGGQAVAIKRRFEKFLKLAPQNQGLIDSLRNVTTKFYVYDDPTISQSFLLRKLRRLGEADIVKTIDHTKVDAKAENDVLDALLHHHLRTLDPEEADLFLVPTPITELIAHGCTEEYCTWFDEAFGALTRHPIFQKTNGNKHVIISFHWSTFNPRYGFVYPAISKSYKRLENVTVAHHYDPFGCVTLSEKTKDDKGIGFNMLFPQELPVTKAFSVGLGIGASFPAQSRIYKQFSRSKYFVFYHTRERPFDYSSTSYRRAAIDEAVIQQLPTSSIGYDLDHDTWVKHFHDSKFCLVLRGDTPHTHAFLHAVRAGCIPVMISDTYQEYAGPFKSSLNIEDFSVVLNEDAFLADPAGELLSLLDLEKDFIVGKLRNMTIVQSMVFPDHPESLFVEALLKEAKVTDETKSVSVALGRPRVEIHEDLVIISGKHIKYRYSSLLSDPAVSDAERMVVGVLAAARKPTARHMVRQTWAGLDPGNVFFVVAGPWDDISEEFINHGDLLWLDIEESYYYGLTYKTEVLLHAAETHAKSYSFLFKTDDDSYIVLEQLSKVLKEHRPGLWGNCNKEEKWRHPERDPSHMHYMPYEVYPDELYPVWASGLGYALSSSFNKCAVAHLATLPFMPMEDVSVGMLAEKCNVQCTQDGWTWKEGPQKTEYFIAHHHVKTAKQMENLHWVHHYDRMYAGGQALIAPPPTAKSMERAIKDNNKRLEKWLQENSKSEHVVASHETRSNDDVIIWIAKVISKSDIFESLLDIVEMSERSFSNNRRLSVYWKFYFFEEEAHDLMKAGLENIVLDESRTELVFEAKKMKPYYWSRYLDPSSIPQAVDYVWLLDGDISLRHMEWECFWTIAHDQLRPSIFQPALLFLDPDREASKTGWHQVVHPSTCQDDPTATMDSLVAIETGFVENQLPVFRRDAWEIVYNQFGAKLGDWGKFETSWGHDLVWCGIVENELHQVSTNNMIKDDSKYNDWRDVERTCGTEASQTTKSSFPIAEVAQTLSDRPVTCAVIHATPVVHLDTKAESDTKKGDTGHGDGEKVRQGFPDAFYFSDCSSFDVHYWYELKDGEKVWLDRGQYRFWRSFTSDVACQSCKSYKCLPPDVLAAV